MIVKGVIDSKDLEQQKILFIRTINTLAPSLNYSDIFIKSIENKAGEIQCKKNSLGFTYNNDIVIPSNRSIYQTIYYVQDGPFVKGLINCVADMRVIQPKNTEQGTDICTNCSLSAECRRKGKSHCYRLEVQELAGISGGGSTLLNEVICKAFSKRYMYVYLVPAVTTKDQNLVEYYKKFANRNRIQYKYDGKHFYFYPFI